MKKRGRRRRTPRENSEHKREDTCKREEHKQRKATETKTIVATVFGISRAR